LAKQFGVSRTAIREAMKALMQSGLVEIHPGRGTFVSDRTSMVVRNSIDMLVRVGNETGIKDLIEVREILEPEIAALAAVRASSEDIQSMEEAVKAMDQAMDDPDMFIEADLDFHLALAQGSNNAIIPVLIDSVVELLREHRIRAASVDGGLERGQPYHKIILAAIKSNDSQTARDSMRSHLEQARKDIEATLSPEEVNLEQE
jgi:DNA-binding FadR family transcriptional regulator